MTPIILKVFLVVSLLMVFVPAILIFSGSGAKTFEPEKVKTRSTNRIYFLWRVVFLLWAFLVGLYCFKAESVDWFWRISLLDSDVIKIFALVITCVGYYLLTALATLHMGEILKPYLVKGEKAPLVTTGIYRHTRNPMHLGIGIGLLATFLLMPNLLVLAMALGMITVLYAVSLDEEKRLLKIYGEEYEKYKENVGMFFPKLKKRGAEK